MKTAARLHDVWSYDALRFASIKNPEDQGYDVIINHAIGTGGRSMEQLIDDGFIQGILDITTHEIVDEMLVAFWEPVRIVLRLPVGQEFLK